uniref:Putative HRP1-subunit of cleavage factor I n=1 Tax=Ustilago esculenta TaxID=185366 RepID=A0A481SH12_9BASI|nr:putative HRP1-subunit of cleavage factor I [Ustilago esculenta]
MRDNLTGRSRGFAFLNFVDPKAVNTVMVREHYLDGKVIDPKRAIPRPQHNNHGGGGHVDAGNYSAQEQKLFVGGLPASVTPESFRRFFEQFGTLLNCTCMMDRETGKPRGFGFLTYQDNSALEHVLNTHPILFDGKEVDVKRAQSKNDPQSLQMRRQQRMDNPGIQQGGRYGMGTGSNNFNVGGGNFANNGWGMNPMMMGMMGQGGGTGGQGGFDPNAMAQMYQSMGWGNQNWNPIAWQQMMANMAGQGGAGANAGGMAMGAMTNSMGMGGMGMMGGAMGSMSPPMMASSMSPTMSSVTAADNGQQQRGSSSGPSGGDDRNERSGSTSFSRYQRGGSHNAGGSRPAAPGRQGGPDGPQDERERSPRSASASRGTDDRGGYRRERSPNRRDDNRRYDNGNRNYRY